MTTKVYYVIATEDVLNAFKTIKNTIPCFIQIVLEDNDTIYHCSIQCREEDVAYVERVLAPYV